MTDAQVLSGPTRKHNWREGIDRHIAAQDSPDGNGRTERTCAHRDCGLVKITVHPPHPHEPWREWHTRDGDVIAIEHAPPCPYPPLNVDQLRSVNQERKDERTET